MFHSKALTFCNIRYNTLVFIRCHISKDMRSSRYSMEDGSWAYNLTPPLSKPSIMTSNNEEAALLARLQAQFGDMDMNQIVSNTNDDETEDEHMDDSESSLEEPTAEEVMRWQQAQYKLAAWAKESKEVGETNETEEIMEWICVEGPAVIDQDSAFFTSSDNDPMLQNLSKESCLGGKWHRLYSSNHDGLSYTGLVSSIRGYGGPTVLLFGPSSLGRISIGFYTSTPWYESKCYYGNKNCFLFKWDDSIQQMQIYHPMDIPEVVIPGRRKKKALYQFCNSTIISAVVSDGRKPGQAISNDNQGVKAPNGLGIGGGNNLGPRLHISETLTNCTAIPCDGTFGAGSLLPSNFNSPNPYLFDIDCMEVWGVGGEERIKAALQARDKERSVKEASRKKNAKVDRMQFLDHFQSDIVHSKAFAHSEFVDERIDTSL